MHLSRRAKGGLGFPFGLLRSHRLFNAAIRNRQPKPIYSVISETLVWNFFRSPKSAPKVWSAFFCACSGLSWRVACPPGLQEQPGGFERALAGLNCPIGLRSFLLKSFTGFGVRKKLQYGYIPAISANFEFERKNSCTCQVLSISAKQNAWSLGTIWVFGHTFKQKVS